MAEQFSGIPGKYVPLKETVRSFKALLSGRYDGFPEQAFMFAGTIEDVIDELTARSKKLEEEMAGVTSDYVKLQALSEEKQKVDEELEEKIERYIELQEIVEG